MVTSHLSASSLRGSRSLPTMQHVVYRFRLIGCSLRPVHLKGIELALNALVDEGDDVLVPSPTYPLYTAILAKIGAQPRYYRTDPDRDWLPDLDHLRNLISSRTRVLVIIDPNNPTGAVYPTAVRRALLESRRATRSDDSC